MRIGIYHGYELTGSGSNEYTRYLAKGLATAGHEVHLICRVERPADFPFVTRACLWDENGRSSILFDRGGASGQCTLHRLPHGKTRPVYLTDKQRAGNVKPFTALTDAELSGEDLPANKHRLRQIATDNYDWSLRADQMERAYRAFSRRA